MRCCAFFTAVTPPETGTTADYVAWLEGLIGADLPDPDDEDVAERQPTA